jgi:hypothetical protein
VAQSGDHMDRPHAGSFTTLSTPPTRIAPGLMLLYSYLLSVSTSIEPVQWPFYLVLAYLKPPIATLFYCLNKY